MHYSESSAERWYMSTKKGVWTPRGHVRLFGGERHIVYTTCKHESRRMGSGAGECGGEAEEGETAKGKSGQILVARTKNVYIVWKMRSTF